MEKYEYNKHGNNFITKKIFTNLTHSGEYIKSDNKIFFLINSF